MEDHDLSTASEEECQPKRTKLNETELAASATEDPVPVPTTSSSTITESSHGPNDTSTTVISSQEPPLQITESTPSVNNEVEVLALENANNSDGEEPGNFEALDLLFDSVVNENSSSPVIRRRSRNLSSRRSNLPIIYSSDDEDGHNSDLLSLSVSSQNSNNSSNQSFILNRSDNSAESEVDDDSDDTDSNDSETSERNQEPSSSTKPLEKEISFLANEKPKHKWIAVREIFYRQNGLTGGFKRQNLKGSMFQKSVCGSLNSVERLELMFKLQKHRGCVNTLSFHPSGELLATGSDDMKVILWKWASNEIALAYESGHTSNIFQAKFFGTPNEIHLITTGRDGQVRHATVPSSGGKPYSRALYKHIGPVHKTAISTSNPTEVLTAGEDAHVICYDIRTSLAQRLLTVRENKRKFPLYSIATSPIDREFCVCGRDQYVRVYDRRNTKLCVRAMCPEKFIGNKRLQVSVSCAVYNYLGDEILATYSDDDIYLFDNKNYEPGKYLHVYRGHSNSTTIKGVNFFGPKSEYVMSGSDCSYIYFWDKESETIVNWMKGDEAGVVNCLEPHPEFPILASSGLDHDIKIWVPSNENPPNLVGLEKKVRRNMRSRRNTRDLECHFDDQIFNLLISGRQRNVRRRAAQSADSEGRVLTTSDLASDDDEAEDDDDDGSTDAEELDMLYNRTEEGDETLSRQERRSLRRIRRVFPCSPS